MPIRRPWLAAVLVLVVAAACGSSTPSTPATSPAPTSTPTDGPSAAPLTPVPGAPSEEPVPSAVTNPGTTETDWGTIFDAVPATFPVFPDAEPADLPEGPTSGTWIANAMGDEVTAWYVEALEAAGYSTDNLSSPLEDGSQVLDGRSDLPECRFQVTFRPANESTMIIVLYGAGCGPF